jgi:hypothetical protein
MYICSVTVKKLRKKTRFLLKAPVEKKDDSDPLFSVLDTRIRIRTNKWGDPEHSFGEYFEASKI